MKKLLFAALLLTLSAIVCARSAQAEIQADLSKPVVVVSFSGYDEILADIDAVGQLAGNPQLSAMVEAILSQATGGQGVVGLDKSKPWGFVLATDGQSFPAYGFIPVSDLDALLGIAAQFVGEPTEQADGLMALDIDGQSLLLKEQGGWVFLSTMADALKDLPEDPVALLDGMNETHDLAVRLSIQNIPAFLRQMGVGMMQMGLQGSMQQMPGESDEDYQTRSEMMQGIFEQIGTTINDLDVIQLGLAIDRETSTIALETSVSAVAGSETAAKMELADDTTTDLVGFLLEGSALTYRDSQTIAEVQVEQIVQSLDMVRIAIPKALEEQGISGDALEHRKAQLDKLLDIVTTSLESGKMDVALSAVVNADAVKIVAGAFVGDGKELEVLFKEVVEELLAIQPEAKDAIELDAATVEGVRYHTASMPLAAFGVQDEMAKQLIGENIEVAVGFNDTHACLAVGRDALATLQAAVAKSVAEAGTSVVPMEMTVSALPIARFVGELGPPQAQMIAGLIASGLEQSDGKDRLTIRASGIENGQMVRIELEEGIVRLIGSLPMMLMGGGM